MAAVACVLSEDQLLCSICLDVFTDPVTTPCGHSFCKTCINKHWDRSPQCHCPVCKERFNSRPQLKSNTFMSEMVHQFKNKPPDEDVLSSEPHSPEVMCDVCSEPKLRALKSCLVCLLSYCQSHLGPHTSIPRLKRHQLIQAVENLENRICLRHDRPLELFCRDDHQFVCVECICEEHHNHNTVPLKKECEVQLEDLKQLLKERREKVEEIQRSVKLNQKNADREMEEGVKVFNDLMKCIKQSLEQFKQSIEKKQKTTEEEAADWMEKIETELRSLEQRRAEMEQVWSSENYLHFLQTFTSTKPAPSVKDWTEVRLKVPSYEGTAAQAVAELQKKLLHPKIKKGLETEVKRVKEPAVDVTLDPYTARLKKPNFLKQVTEPAVDVTLNKYIARPKKTDFFDTRMKRGEESAKDVTLNPDTARPKKLNFLKRVTESAEDVTLDPYTARLKKLNFLKRVTEPAVDVTLNKYTTHTKF